MSIALTLTTVWIVTLISVLGVAAGAFLAIGSVISIANMKVSWAGTLLLAALGVPLAFGIAGIGAWWMYFAEAGRFFTYLVFFPWVYLVAFIAAMVISFRFITP